MNQYFWTPSENIELIKLRQQGFSCKYIARNMGISISSVLNKCHRNRENYKNLTPDEAKVISLVTDIAANGDILPLNYRLSDMTGIPQRQLSAVLKSLSQKGVMDILRNKQKRRVAYLFVGFLSTKDAGCAEAGFKAAHNPAHDERKNRIASMNLLRRQLETGAHWIRDPAQFRAACESVGLEVAA